MNVGVECAIFLHQLMYHHLIVSIHIYETKRNRQRKQLQKERQETTAVSPAKQTAEHLACTVLAQISRWVRARVGNQPAEKWVVG
jgi:hypothetical protein